MGVDTGLRPLDNPEAVLRIKILLFDLSAAGVVVANDHMAGPHGDCRASPKNFVACVNAHLADRGLVARRYS